MVLLCNIRMNHWWIRTKYDSYWKNVLVIWKLSYFIQYKVACYETQTTRSNEDIRKNIFKDCVNMMYWLGLLFKRNLCWVHFSLHGVKDVISSLIKVGCVFNDHIKVLKYVTKWEIYNLSLFQLYKLCYFCEFHFFFILITILVICK